MSESEYESMAYELLEELANHPKLHAEWEEIINETTWQEGYQKLSEFIKKRKTGHSKPKFIEHTESLDNRWSPERVAKLREHVKEKITKSSRSIGSRNTADVREELFEDEQLSSYCLKIVSDINSQEYLSNRTIKEEFELMLKLWEQPTIKKMMPEHLYWIDLGDKHVLVMEKLDALDLHLYICDETKDVSQLPLPQNFDYQEFINKLDACIKAMHKLGIHHCDLHANNVMVTKKTFEPMIIDFGKSRKLVFSSDDPYKVDNSYTGKVHTYMNDQLQIKSFKAALKKKLEKGGSHV